MHKTVKSLIVLTWIAGLCGFASCAEVSPLISPADANSQPVDGILKGLQKAAGNLKSYQCKVEYQFNQPVLDSNTLRTGTLYYARFNDGSKLRIDFNTLTQEDGPPQKYVECYIFDGQWLTHIDYQIKQAQKRQLAEANEPIDAFELARRNFPIIGFGRTEDLEKQFDVNLVIDSNNQIHLVAESNQFEHLHLNVKTGSQYAEQYKAVDIWIDRSLDLPARVSAVSTDADIYEIKFIQPKVNEMIDKKVFDVTIPEGFGKTDIVPLKGG